MRRGRTPARLAAALVPLASCGPAPEAATEAGEVVTVGSGDHPTLRAELDLGARPIEVAGATATTAGWRGCGRFLLE